MQKRVRMPSVRLPSGLKFQPTDEDLISDHLMPKFRKVNVPPRFISSSEDVYEKPPSKYCTNSTAFFGDDNIAKHYFFTDLKRPEGKERADRSVGSNALWYESNKKEIKNNNNEIIGYKKLLKFKLKNEVKKDTGWSMHEFSLCLPTNLVLCVIQNKNKVEKGRRLVLDLDLDSGSGTLEIAQVKCWSEEDIAEAERGTGGLYDDTGPKSHEDIAWLVHQRPATDEISMQKLTDKDKESFIQKLTDNNPSSLLDSTTTANENPCPAQDEETQQSKKMRYNPQLEDVLKNVQIEPSSLLDSTTTANENPCPAQDEETQQSKKMRHNPQLEDELKNVQIEPSSLLDSTTTANENPCPAQDEETQQRKKMRHNPQLEDELKNVQIEPSSLPYTNWSYHMQLYRLVMDSDLDLDSGSGTLEIARVKSWSEEDIAEAERGTGGLHDDTGPQSPEDIAGLLHQRLATDKIFIQKITDQNNEILIQEFTDDNPILLLDSTTTANENPCPAQDEETQQRKKMRYNPQLEDELENVQIEPSSPLDSTTTANENPCPAQDEETQ